MRPGLKELYARYEANFESQSICYTYITTITVPLEALSSLPPQGLWEGITYPVAIPLPPSSFDGPLASSSDGGPSSLSVTYPQTSDIVDTTGLLRSVAGFPPGSDTLHNPPPDSTGRSDTNGSASRVDASTFTNIALTSRSRSSATADVRSDIPSYSLGSGSAVNPSSDIFTSTHFLSDITTSTLGLAVDSGSNIFTSTNFPLDIPTSSLGSAVIPSSDISASATFPSAIVVSSLLLPPEPVSLPFPPLDSLSYTALGPTSSTLSLSIESSASEVAEFPSATRTSGGETATGTPSVIRTSAAGSSTSQNDGFSIVNLPSFQLVPGTSLIPTPADTSQPGDVTSQRNGDGSVQSETSQNAIGGLSISVPGADPTVGTTSPAGGVSRSSLDSRSSSLTILSTSETNSNDINPGSSISSHGSILDSSLPGVATPSELVTDAASLSDTSSTFYETLSPSAASRVILSVRSELPPALAPTITITEEATSSHGPARLVRRQIAEAGNSTAGFIGNDELPNPNSCSNARLFVRSSGALRTEGEPLSVDPGVPYIDIANYTRGSITTRFDVVNGTLVWANSLFYGGQAGFCQMNGSSVYATFTAAGGPQDCTDVNLVVYRGTLFVPNSFNQVEEHELTLRRGPMPVWRDSQRHLHPVHLES